VSKAAPTRMQTHATMTGPAESESGNAEISTNRIEVVNLILVAVTVGAFWLFSTPDRALGALAGGALAGGSFRVIAFSVKRLLETDRRRKWPGLLLWIKFSLIFVVVGVLILKVNIDVLGLLVGISLILPSIVFEAVCKLAAREERTP